MNSDPYVGTLFGGRWLIDRPLTSGGMGAVYVAKHNDTGRRVALKIIKSESANNAEFVSRFRRETGALAAVSHPNVVTFLDSGIENGNLFLVMELLAGRSLRDEMSQPMEWKRAFRICADVCRALAAVHDIGLVHRDLKPENVFLQDSIGHEEFAKLIDFGIVRLETQGSATMSTQTGAIVGTPGYISPEQLQGKSASAASDVYAVGVMLYELVTGRFPFTAPNVQAMLVRQLLDPVIPPREIAPTIPNQVDNIILRLIEKDPARRPATAKEALRILRDALNIDSRSLSPTAVTETGQELARLTNVLQPRPTAATPMHLVVEESGPVVGRKKRIKVAAVASATVAIAAILVVRLMSPSISGTAVRTSEAAVPPPSTTAEGPTAQPSPLSVEPSRAVPAREPETGATSAPAGVAAVDLPRSETNSSAATPSTEHKGPLLDKLPKERSQMRKKNAFEKPSAEPKPAPSASDVATFVRQHSADLLSCEGERAPRTIALAVEPAGQIVVKGSDTDAPFLCAREKVSRWRMPAFDGAPVTVSASLVLGSRKLAPLRSAVDGNADNAARPTKLPPPQ